MKSNQKAETSGTGVDEIVEEKTAHLGVPATENSWEPLVSGAFSIGPITCLKYN